MLPEALIARGKRVTAPFGYAQAKTTWVLRISLAGEFISLDKEPQTRVLPSLSRTSGILAYSGIDNYQYVLGVGAPGRELAWAKERHEAYRALMEEAPGAEAAAILAFLDNPKRPLILPVGTELSEEEAAQVLQYKAKPSSDKKTRDANLKAKKVLQEDPAVQGVYGCLIENAKAHHPDPDNAEIRFVDDNAGTIFYIEVGGDPLWHHKPEFKAFHLTRVSADNAKTGEVRGTCSLCHQEAVLARTFPKGPLSPVSFNASSWSSYGAQQAYNVPTCVDCAYLFMQGLNHIVATKGSMEMVGDKRILWWSDNPNNTPMFTLLSTALNPETTDKDREKALEEFTDGHIAVMEPLMGRTSVQRYYTTSATVIRANLRHWLSTVGTRGLYEMSHVFQSENRSKSKGSNNNALQMLYLHLIANEEIPTGVLRRIRVLMARENTSYQRREKLLQYLRESPTADALRSASTEEEAPMSLDEIRAPENYTSLEKAAFWFGMAFGKAETNQRGRSNPQRTIGDTHYRAASKSPDKCAVVCRKHGRYFSKRLNRMLEDQRLGAWLEQAESFLDQLSDRPRIFNPKAQRAFGRGYHTFKQANKLRQAQSTTTDTE